jgi:hypothetical protein
LPSIERRKRGRSDESTTNLVNRFGRPGHGTGLSAIRGLWATIPHNIKTVQAIGRTTGRCQPSVDPDTLEAMADAVGVFDKIGPGTWNAMSPSYKLDTITTYLLERDRQEHHAALLVIKREFLRRVGAKNTPWKDVPYFKREVYSHNILSPWQAGDRARNEIPLKISAVEAIQAHKPWRLRKF